MGCFNVACSVSNLSINAGDPVVYIPLLPKHWKVRKYPQIAENFGKVGTHSGLIYSNCYFNPLTLPIRGFYNDYGGIEDVARDANTKAIEKYFGMPIEDFVNSVERNWCREYLDDQKKIVDNFFEFPDLFNNVSKSDLTKEFMSKMGFVETDRANYYIFKEMPYLIKTRFGGKTEGYYILDKETEEVVKERIHNGFYRNYLLADLAELTGYYIGISDEMQGKIEIMENLSGMFIHGDIYDKISNPPTRADFTPNADMLEELGFVLDSTKKSDRDGDKFYHHPEVEDAKAYIKIPEYGSPSLYDKDSSDKYYGHWLKSSYELAEDYIAKHGVVLDLTPYEKQYGSAPSFKKIQNSIKAYEDFSKLRDETKDSKELIKIMTSMPFGHPLSGSNLRDSGLWAFEEWDYLKEIYNDAFKEGTILKEFCEWIEAKGFMYSANVFFFPAMNGEQHGNDAISKELYQAALAVIEARERLYREENLCPNCKEDGCEWDCE